MSLRFVSSAVLTIDGDGNASGTIDGVRGRIHDVHVAVDGSCNVTLATAGTGALLAKTLLTLTGISADTVYKLRNPTHGSTGAALTFDSTEGVNDFVVVQERITVTVASGTENDTVQVAIEFEVL